MRKRDQLLQFFPAGTFSPAEASEALRQSDGCLDKAKAILEQAKKPSPPKTANPTETGTSSKPAAKQQPTKELVNTMDLSRRPPQHSVGINNLSDCQYCCVWWVEVYEDGYRPDVARSLLAQVARHVNPILRNRGWRVKRLMETVSTQFLGCCTSNGRGDADAASANIQLNVRVQPHKDCRQFRTFAQLLNVMLHEITHISIGLEDIHPPAFWELLQEIKGEYATKLAAGEVALETEEYGCPKDVLLAVASGNTNGTGDETTVDGQNCGAGKGRRRRLRPNGKRKAPAVKAIGIQAAQQSQKRRPLLKGVKMVDKRTKVGKATMDTLKELTPRELAARAALARLGSAATAPPTASLSDNKPESSLETMESSNDSDSQESDNDDEVDAVEDIVDHQVTCACRACRWEELLCHEIVAGFRDWS